MSYTSYCSYQQYQVKPSAFIIAEKPLSVANKLLSSQEFTTGKIVGYFAGIIALPITIAITPITIVADIITGIGETIFCLYRGYSHNDCLEVAKRKIIIAPFQQIVFLATNAGLYFLINGTFGIPVTPWLLILWPIHYAASKVLINKMLPPCLGPTKISIFADDRFSLDKPTTSKATTDNRPVTDRFTETIKEVLESGNLTNINDPRVPSDYIDFKKRIKSNVSAEELFGLFGSHNHSTIHQHYLYLFMLLHPHNNPYCQKEAAELFKCLEAAYLVIQQELPASSPRRHPHEEGSSFG